MPAFREAVLKKIFLNLGICAALVATIPGASNGAVKKTELKKPPDGSLAKLYEGLEFRSIGPYRGGRVDAVVGVRGQPLVYYFGGTGGGVWKTVDGGSNWQAMSDKDFKTGSGGTRGIPETAPDGIYAGIGEAATPGNGSH